MAKRFTDSEKWKKPWFRKLSPTMKLVWNYVLDNCDYAGVWPADFELMSFQLGIEVSRKEVTQSFGERIKRIDEGKFFIPAFIEFQYGTLNPDNNAHRGVIKLLDKLGAHEGLTTPSRGAQDKDKDKDKEQDQDQDQEQEGGVGETRDIAPQDLAPGADPEPFQLIPPALDFEALYRAYGRKEGKTPGLKQCREQIRTEGEYERLRASVVRYTEHCTTTGQIMKHFGSFMGSKRTGHPWREWLEPETGESIKPRGNVMSINRAETVSQTNQAMAERVKRGEL